MNGSTGDKTGLGITLKVMSGDIIDIFGKSFWHSSGVNPNNTYTISSVLSSFINAFAGTSAVVTSGHNATGTTLNGSSTTTTGLTSWLNSVPNPSLASVPKAYINWILFDEQFKPVSSGSGFDLISTTPDAVKSHHSTVNIATGGYLYVYCSNESNIDVFFDNLQVIQTRGPLLETTDYYPFGLTMGGISSKAANSLINRFKYNGKEEQRQEFGDGSGLEWLDYGTRMYDNQIGRWYVVDQLSENSFYSSPYNYALDNPINLIDPDGRSTTSTHTDSLGNVLAVYNDGDLGVYKHNDAKTKADVDKDRKKSKSTSGGGEKEGETEYWDEFLIPGTDKPAGKIEFGKSWDDVIDKLHKEAMEMDLKEIGENSKLHKEFDLKDNKDEAPNGPMTGKLLDGKYATARSAGNYLAGYNGSRGTYFGMGISFTTYMKLAGALQVGKYNQWNAFRIVTFGISFGPAPWYGEIEYTGRMVKLGWNAPRY